MRCSVVLYCLLSPATYITHAPRIYVYICMCMCASAGGYGVVSAQVFMTRAATPRSRMCGKVVLRDGTSVWDVISRLNG